MPQTYNFSVQVPDFGLPPLDHPTNVKLRIEHSAHRPRRIRRRLHGSDRINTFSGTLLAQTNQPQPIPTAPQQITVVMPGFYPPTQDQTVTFDFMFWSVTGVKSVLDPITNRNLTLQVGETDIVATAWYGGYGTGGGDNGIILDAFDLDLNSYVDDDFVKVPTRPLFDPAFLLDSLVDAAANDGNLNTVEWLPGLQDCLIVANSSLIEEPGKFMQWLLPDSLIKTGKTSIGIDANSPNTLNVKRNAEAFAFAVFKKEEEIDECVGLTLQVFALLDKLKKVGKSTPEASEIRRQIIEISHHMNDLNCPPILNR